MSGEVRLIYVNELMRGHAFLKWPDLTLRCIDVREREVNCTNVSRTMNPVSNTTISVETGFVGYGMCVC